MNHSFDLFISHASADAERYISPLAEALSAKGISFWLDTQAIAWGDNFVMKINDGLKNAQYMLLCLSKAFLSRSWTEHELSSALSLQNSDGRKRVLPLILNSKREVLRAYPILRSLSYRELNHDFVAAASELSVLVGQRATDRSLLQLSVASMHTGEITAIEVPSSATVDWFATTAARRLGLALEADVVSFEEMTVRWIPVDTTLIEVWEEQLPRYMRFHIRAVFKRRGKDRQSICPQVFQRECKKIGKKPTLSG